MKETYYSVAIGLLLSLILGICSCTDRKPDNTYVVEGTIQNSKLNGKTIYIMRYDDKKLIDTTVIRNNKFAFTGKVDTASYCRIDLSDKFSSFILEPGRIRVDLNGQNEDVHGTILNEQMNIIANSEDSIYTILKQKNAENSSRDIPMMLLVII